MEIIIAILSALLIVAGFAIRNVIKKNEELEDFITKQSEAIDNCDRRLNQIDDKGFTEIKKIQEALNEFRLR